MELREQIIRQFGELLLLNLELATKLEQMQKELEKKSELKESN